MNINEHSFVNNPVGVDRPRSTFARNSTIRTTLDAGKLVPFYLDEVLPGDTFDVSTSLVCRMITPLFPVMDDCFLDTYYFFVPHRLVWDHWKEFNGENTDSAWVSDIEYSVPSLQLNQSDLSVSLLPGSVFDYLGLPPVQLDEIFLSALPYRSYQLIWNDWFRDQNLMDPVFINKSDTPDAFDISFENGLLPVCKFHDYFTSALPAPLKAQDPVKVPIGSVPVITGPVNPDIEAPKSVFDTLLFKLDGNVGTPGFIDLKAVTAGGVPGGSDDVAGTYGVSGSTGAPSYWATPANLYTDNGGVFSVNDLRLAFQTQRYYEALARGGSRYNEIILSLFGVHVPDATVQRPEYLGGQRVNIRLNEVVQQSESNNSPLGSVAAYSKTSDSSHSFTKSFSEHGYVIGLCCIRPNHSYSQGIDKLWMRRNKFDFYIPQFAHLGEQPIYNAEIFYDTSAPGNIKPDGVFGYQEAWAEYRFKTSKNTAMMRPANNDFSLDRWHYGDFYEEQPVLSAEWIAETDENIDRTLAVTDSYHQFWIDFYIANNTTRVMPMYSIPGLIDHF